MEDDFNDKVTVQEQRLLDILEGICIDTCLSKYHQAYGLLEQIPDQDTAEKHVAINHMAVKKVLVKLGRVFNHTTCVVEEMQGRTNVSKVLADVEFKDIEEVPHK